MADQPRDLASTWQDIAVRGQRLLSHYQQRMLDGQFFDVDAIKRLTEPFLTLTRAWLSEPGKLLETQMRFWFRYSELLQKTTLRMFGLPVAPVVEPEPDDRRFNDPAWAENLLFSFIKQSYLLVAESLVAGAEIGAKSRAAAGGDPLRDRRLSFYTRHFIDAMSPSNFALTNPTVLRATIDSGGENLVRGLRNLLGDLEAGQGRLRISMTDRSAFTIGENLATTKGKVVFQSELMQLIQYQPTTDQVHRRPLLLVPPWINKYYILDLQAHNSFARWAVERGFTVFMISWVNPDERLAHKRFDDYLADGILAGLRAIERATGEREINVLSYCIGGILMGSALAYLAVRGDRRVTSATFLTTLLDFADVGDIDVFIGEDDIQYVEAVMARKGYFEAERMADSFSMLRANDLIWSYVIRNYLLGHEPTPFDMLYWATDNTRMPAAMHSFYLRNYYLHNRLCQPGGITLLSVPLDLSAVEVPSYFLSTENDHIAPWESTYIGARHLSGPVEFVLAGSGHIAGVINPAGSQKYGYKTAPAPDALLPQTAADWLHAAQHHRGSWWPHWLAWVRPHAGPLVPARTPGDGALPVLEDAPGSYVQMT